jgi:hypothetical protein
MWNFSSAICKLLKNINLRNVSYLKLRRFYYSQQSILDSGLWKQNISLKNDE